MRTAATGPTRSQTVLISSSVALGGTPPMKIVAHFGSSGSGPSGPIMEACSQLNRTSGSPLTTGLPSKIDTTFSASAALRRPTMAEPSPSIMRLATEPRPMSVQSSRTRTGPQSSGMPCKIISLGLLSSIRFAIRVWAVARSSSRWMKSSDFCSGVPLPKKCTRPDMDWLFLIVFVINRNFFTPDFSISSWRCRPSRPRRWPTKASG
mmetsp:Transcript_137296/g.342314  ORF Transcript_137296/g.342314 Transcript_137296/m.342314 type:complete len:207 (+) Transcript_137296:593-1213(+)